MDSLVLSAAPNTFLLEGLHCFRRCSDQTHCVREKMAFSHKIHAKGHLLVCEGANSNEVSPDKEIAWLFLKAV